MGNADIVPAGIHQTYDRPSVTHQGLLAFCLTLAVYRQTFASESHFPPEARAPHIQGRPKRTNEDRELGGEKKDRTVFGNHVGSTRMLSALKPRPRSVRLINRPGDTASQHRRRCP